MLDTFSASSFTVRAELSPVSESLALISSPITLLSALEASPLVASLHNIHHELLQFFLCARIRLKISSRDYKHEPSMSILRR
jgi:hypothetical protein